MTKFNVDDVLLWHSPFTDQDMRVIYRGPFDAGRSVVFNPVSGWQGAVENQYLRLAKCACAEILSGQPDAVINPDCPIHGSMKPWYPK